MIDEQIDQHVDAFLRTRLRRRARSPSGPAQRLGVEFEARDFRGMDFDDGRAVRQGRSRADRPKRRCTTRSKRTCPAKAKTTKRMELGSAGQDGQHPLGAEPPRPRPEEDRPRPRRRVSDREGPRGDPTRSICREGEAFLEEDFPQQTHRRLGAAQVRRRARARRSQAAAKPTAAQGLASAARPTRPTTQKEAEYPGDGRALSLHRPATAQQARLDREGLVAWARERFGVELDVDDLKSKQRDEIRDAAGRAQPAIAAEGRDGASPRCSKRLDELFGERPRPNTARRGRRRQRRSSIRSPMWLERIVAIAS